MSGKESEKKFIIEYEEDGAISRVGILHGQFGNIYEIEFLDWFTIENFASLGSVPSTSDEDIVLEQFYEIDANDLKEVKTYRTWRAVLGEIIRDQRKKGRLE